MAAASARFRFKLLAAIRNTLIGARRAAAIVPQARGSADARTLVV